MSGLMLEIGQEYPHVEVEVIPGVTAANGGAAVLGAPLIHDFAVISLSDLLTPWEKIEKRLLCASGSGFCGFAFTIHPAKTSRLSAEGL